MAIDPKRVAAQVASRTLQLEGSTQSALNISYAAFLASGSGMDGSDVPLLGLIDAVVAAEGQIADLIAGDKSHPYRETLRARSDNLATGAEIPTESDEGVKFVGVFSGVNDSTGHYPLTEGTIQEIERFLRASDGRYTTAIRKYKFWGGRLHHTRTRAYIEGCAWSRSQARNRFALGSTQLSPLPTAYEPAWVAQAIAFLAKEGWLMQEAGYYQQFAASSIAAIKSRSLDIPAMPTQEASANAVTN